MVQCRIPREVDDFVLDGQWAFIRHGSVFLALGALKGSMAIADTLSAALAAEFRVLKIREAKTALFVMVEDGGGPFEEFMERAKAAAPSYDDTDPSVRLTDAHGREVTVRYQIPSRHPERPGYWLTLPEVTVDGSVQPYNDTPVFDTPFLRLAEGVLSLHGRPGAFSIAPGPNKAMPAQRRGENRHRTPR